ncbi:hypothetical protein LCGC14_2177880, partial [marine sediment metagenome]
QRTTGQTTKRAADRFAADLAVEESEGRTGELRWADFCEAYESSRRRWSEKSRESWGIVKKWLGRLGCPATLQGFDSGFCARWQAKLTAKGLSEASVATYGARLKASLNWASEQEMIDRAPRIHVKAYEEPRSREVRLEEFERMLLLLPKVRPRDHPIWDRLLRGFWYSDFRLNELRRLSWNSLAPLWLHVPGDYPMVRIARRGQKSRKSQLQPIVPEFWAVCCETPEDLRRGRVFELPNGKGGQLAYRTVQGVIAKIGKRAGIITNSETGKFATVHDLRRGFGTRMAQYLTLPELAKWMRHKHPKTTTTFYHQADAEQLASKVWAQQKGGALGGAPKSPVSGDT